MLWGHGNLKIDINICCNIILFLFVNTERNYWFQNRCQTKRNDFRVKYVKNTM